LGSVQGSGTEARVTVREIFIWGSYNTIFLYGCESWAVNKMSEMAINFFERRTLRQ